jgi:hypothetical protein
MKNVLLLVQTKINQKVLMIKTFDQEKHKYVWSLPNVKFHWNVQNPLKSGKLAGNDLFNTFTFGICNENFLNENKKFLLPSGNIVYKIQIMDENAEKIPNIFKSLKSNNNIKLDITKLEFQNFNYCLHVKAFSNYHYETIEAVQFIVEN